MSEVLRREIRNLPREEVLETLVQMWGGVGGVVTELVRRGAIPLVLENLASMTRTPADPTSGSRFRAAIACV